MTLTVTMHSPITATVHTFDSGNVEHATVTFALNDSEVSLFFSREDVWKAQALVDAFNSRHSPTPPVLNHDGFDDEVPF